MASRKKSKKAATSTNGAHGAFDKYRTLANVDEDIESLAGVLRHVCATVDKLDAAFKRLEAHVEEQDLKIIFSMNTISITRERHGGLVGPNGESEKITKKLMAWYREGGRDRLVMKLAEAEHEIKKARAAAEAEGDVAELVDRGSAFGDEASQGEGSATTGTPAKKDPGPTIN